MVSRVFVSHSSKDTWVAQQLGRRIQETGASTFLDEANIDHGDDFDEMIVQAAKDCSELVILMTPWSVKRPYIWIEMGLFRRDQKRIVGILHGLEVGDVSADEQIPKLLKKLDFVGINEVETYLDQLRRRVQEAESK
jgi:hypothetical protein